MRVVAVVVLLVLTGCGGSGDEPTRPKTKATPSATAKPTTATPTGRPAPEALGRFRCVRNAKKVWNASGYLTNPGKNKQTYQVTVYVGEATGGEEKALTKQVPSIAPGGSVKFVIAKIPAPKTGGQCYVQVIATK